MIITIALAFLGILMFIADTGYGEFEGLRLPVRGQRLGRLR